MCSPAEKYARYWRGRAIHELREGAKTLLMDMADAYDEHGIWPACSMCVRHCKIHNVDAATKPNVLCLDHVKIILDTDVPSMVDSDSWRKYEEIQ